MSGFDSIGQQRSHIEWLVGFLWRGRREAEAPFDALQHHGLARHSALADTLVTHEASGYHCHGFALLDTLAQVMGVRVLVHGHHHDRLDNSAVRDAQGFKSHGGGLRGVTAIDVEGCALVIVPGELDQLRAGRGDGQ